MKDAPAGKARAPGSRVPSQSSRFDLIEPQIRKKVWDYCRLLLRGTCAAALWEDCAQESLIAVWKASEQRDMPIDEWQRFVLRIARNKCIDQIRASARKPRTEYEESLLQAVSSLDEHGGPEYQLLADCLALLEVRQQEALVLFHICSCSYARIGSVLGATEANVGAILTRARAQLRNCAKNRSVTPQ